jgi:pantetheine-phosphate adenylyltransferase
MKNMAVYPGTFDPVTFGHLDLVQRALKLFDYVVVAVAESPLKHPLFDLETRVAMVREVLSAESRVKVQGFDCLLTTFVQDQGAKAVIRGLRAVSDFEYEFMLAGINRRLMADLETVFLMPSEQYMFITSSSVKEVAKLKGDVSAFVPEAIRLALDAQYA